MSSGALLLLHLLSFLSFAMSQRPSLNGELTFRYDLSPSDQNNTTFSNFMYNVGRLFNQKLNKRGSKSIYYGEYLEKVYGIYLCRFDITGETCQNGIADGTDRLVKECKSNETAIIWFDECMVRYSDRSFFSTLETEPVAYMWNSDNITELVVLAEILNQTLNKAIDFIYF
ncbi:hypothetical protein Dsin_015984 [Dipteronia sinensis]|uniref:Gnk2-homologous domain-containing protein n=1 Tax=Dipteronia sinensis TaxID=43782 RepID=A0AAE0ACZ9_9ROSI|nr:hypothetical protein Dsin_015984 [Dipteronia sinensis]